ncbi:MAG: TRAP transporter small permease [Dehalococcoidia bacterium]|nr:TRAP transporter small permease [Dehalococcoidia bacterium]
MMDIVKKLDYGFQLFCAYLLALSVCLLMAIIVLREFFGISYDFLVDTTVWLTIWSMLLLSGPLFGEGGHIAIKALLGRIPGRFRLTVEFFNALCTLVFVTIVTYGGVLLIHTLYSQHQVYPRYIAIPMWMVQICVPIGLLLFAVYAIAELYRIVQRMRA